MCFEFEAIEEFVHIIPFIFDKMWIMYEMVFKLD